MSSNSSSEPSPISIVSIPNGVSHEFPYRPRHTIAVEPDNSMTITDGLYGTMHITDPVLLDLIRDSSFQRLHGIHQHGITPVINVNKVNPSVTRLEHSVGAMLLIRTLVPYDLAQQCAALLHDVSHTVLSHVTDYVFGYVIHEVEKEDYVKTTNIPQILAKYGYDWKHITSEEPGTWTLLEQPAPLLCADRLDYGLRDMLAFHVHPPETVRDIVKQFVVYDGRIMCSDIPLAGKLARGYQKCDELAWANPHHSGLYKFAGNAIRLALAHQVIKKEELWIGTDSEFWQKILDCGIPEIEEHTRYTNDWTKFEIVSSKKNGDLVLELKLKIRTIDPEIVIQDENEVQVRRLSEVDPTYAKERQDYINSKKGPIFLAVS